MMMKASPRTTFEMIQPQIILGALKVLFDVPAGTAQLQAAGLGGGTVEMGQIIAIGFSIPRQPQPTHSNPEGVVEHSYSELWFATLQHDELLAYREIL